MPHPEPRFQNTPPAELEDVLLCLQENWVLLAFFKPDSKPDTPVVTWENNICPAYLQRPLEDSSEPFYKVQSDLQIQGFYYY